MNSGNMRGLVIAVLLCVALSGYGNIRLPRIISSNMVLQQLDSVKIWGWADPYEEVTVTPSWSQQGYKATGSRDARWEVKMATPAAGGPYTITIRGNNIILLENVMIGEVWICSGQSNMEMNAQKGLQDAKAELSSAHLHNIRFFHI